MWLIVRQVAKRARSEVAFTRVRVLSRRGSATPLTNWSSSIIRRTYVVSLLSAVPRHLQLPIRAFHFIKRVSALFVCLRHLRAATRCQQEGDFSVTISSER